MLTQPLEHIIRVSEDETKMFRPDAVIIVEDDFELCPNGIMLINVILNELIDFDPNWIEIRFSFGGNGLTFKAKDLSILGEYVGKHRARRINDHLYMEWFNSETNESMSYVKNRTHVTSRYNLFKHIGMNSNWPNTKHTKKKYPACMEDIWHIFGEWERFNFRRCPNAKIYPCKNMQDEPIITNLSNTTITHTPNITSHNETKTKT